MDKLTGKPPNRFNRLVGCVLMLALVFSPAASPLVLAQDDQPPEAAPQEEQPAQATPPAEDLPADITQPTPQPEPQVTPEPMHVPARPPDEPFSAAGENGTFYPASGTHRYVDQADGSDDDNDCLVEDDPCATITHAVEQANADDLIHIDPGTYQENITGLDKSLRFEGSGWQDTGTIIEGLAAGESVISGVDEKVHLDLNFLTIRNGSASGHGGGIYSPGPLNLSYVHVTKNTAAGSGGGIYAGGTIIMNDVEVDNNTADCDGGGIYLDLPSNPSITSEGVTIAENNAPTGSGGGLYLRSDAVPVPTLRLKNSTISGNHADHAGAVFISNAAMDISYATITSNASLEGAAMINDHGTFYFKGTIVANNTPTNCQSDEGTWTSLGYNLESHNSCNFGTAAGDLINEDPMLQTLAYFDIDTDNTRTHALKHDSPAIDKAENPPYAPESDQRRLNRTADGDGNGVVSADIGAFEFFFPTDVHINSHDPNPSLPGQAVTVEVWVESTYQPGATGRVYIDVFGESTYCEITLDEEAKGSCQLTFTTPGEKTLNANYGGDTNHYRAISSTTHRVCEIKTYTSTAAYDGWLLESARTSNKGGSKNNAAATLSVGDDAKNRQYRSILHFNTATLPDNAVITSVKLQVRRAGIKGTNPFNTHGALYVDLRKGAFSGSNALQLADWQAAASKSAAGKIPNTPVSNWYSMTLAKANFGYINKKGVTQLRLRFNKDDNDDRAKDTINFFSGNCTTIANRPRLIVTYYVP